MTNDELKKYPNLFKKVDKRKYERWYETPEEAKHIAELFEAKVVARKRSEYGRVNTVSGKTKGRD